MAALCQGSAALLSATTDDGSFTFAGHAVTSLSDEEEKQGGPRQECAVPEALLTRPGLTRHTVEQVVGTPMPPLGTRTAGQGLCTGPHPRVPLPHRSGSPSTETPRTYGRPPSTNRVEIDAPEDTED
ncbi:hypothetical protein GCM10012280_70590 [Wenjunlia tyrosinilytica]|uniref:Uncharacterized protein n=1 Tax=Wenjunlia tyrosinilytica TaxID=1544741 RepID=A0A918E1F9_9ACTN|nr:hypothetical protein GCM10012280_70590 [Wenjunlia tyrosinilytica]